MHILVRDGLADRDYIAKHTLGFDKVERDVLPKFTPARTAEITGLRWPTSKKVRGDVRQGQGRA